MSVVEPERHKGRLEVHVKAQALAAYTALIVKNQKVFDPEVDEDLIKRIKSYSMDIYEKAWAANKINAETNQINRAMRYQLQEEALPGIIKTCGKDGKRMLKIVKRLLPLAEEGRVNRLTSELAQERQRNDDLEAALVEVADMVAAQDDALVEIAELVGE